MQIACGGTGAGSCCVLSEANFSWEERQNVNCRVFEKHINDLLVLQLQSNCVKLSQMQSVEFMKSQI